MPEYLRSLIVVLFITTTVFVALQRSFIPLMPSGAFGRRRNTFLALAACSFLAPGFWFYAFAAAAVILLARTRERNTPALFFALLFAVPPAGGDIPGMGLVNFLLSLDHPRLLSLLLLLPAAIVLSRKPLRSASTVIWPDRFFGAYLLLQAALICFRSDSLTNGLRGVVYLGTDVFLPYYVMSRAFANSEELKDMLAAFCFAGLLLSAIAIFESMKHWLLYRSLLDRWATAFAMGNYLSREGVVRAVGTTGQPIVLGYVVTIALVCFLALKPEIRGNVRRKLVGALLIGGLLATFSRGPWLGALVAAFAFWAAANRSRMLVALGIAVAIAMAVLFGSRFPLLPAVTGVDQSTIDYRAELFSKSLEVFAEHPWIGSDMYVHRLAAKGMVQGQGIVDVVNTYVGVALSSGAIGLALFLSLLIAVLLGLWKSIRIKGSPGTSPRANTPSLEMRGSAFNNSLAARALFSALIGIVVSIGTTSSISVIPWVFWAWMGAAVACIRMASIHVIPSVRVPSALLHT